jgi:polar amino acid transport system permease protein
MQSAGTSPLEQPPLRRRRSRPVWERAPWWLLVVSITMAAVVLSMLQTERYARTFAYLLRGVGLTLWISIVSYAIALVIGLLAGLGRVARNRLLNTLSSIYVEVVRGIPLLVIIIAAQFIVAPALNTNRMPVLSGIMALAVGYGAYLAEIYRAGIQSLERGQMDAARSLGMSYRQSMRYVILPQAIRRVLPALGNDFVALL